MQLSKTHKLVQFRLHRPSKTRKNRKATAYVQQKGRARASTDLFGGLNDWLVLYRAWGRVKTFFELHSSSWSEVPGSRGEDGERIIANASLSEVLEGVADLRVEAERLLDEFCRNYDQHIDDARRLLDEWDERRFPTVDEFRSKFSISLAVKPIPSEFVELETDDPWLRAEIERANEKAAKAARVAVRNEVAALAEALNDLAQAADAHGKPIDGASRNGSFRDTKVTHVARIAKLLKPLAQDDDRLKRLVEQAEEIGKADPDDLRKYDHDREVVGAKAAKAGAEALAAQAELDELFG